MHCPNFGEPQQSVVVGLLSGGAATAAPASTIAAAESRARTDKLEAEAHAVLLEPRDGPLRGSVFSTSPIQGEGSVPRKVCHARVRRCLPLLALPLERGRGLAAADADGGYAARHVVLGHCRHSVTRMRAPEAPIGCPSAQAPPCTLSSRVRSRGRASPPSARRRTPRSPRGRRRPCSSLQHRAPWRSPWGAVVYQAGSCAWLAVATMRASGAIPRRRASEARISTSEAAPSEIELELAAVTVPSARNTGFSGAMRPDRR